MDVPKNGKKMLPSYIRIQIMTKHIFWKTKNKKYKKYGKSAAKNCSWTN